MVLKFLKIKIDKLYLVIVLIFFAQCSKKDHFSYNGTNFEENQIYLFFRETDSKAGIVSKSYNVNNYSYSHVGIGGIIDKKLMVYHILYDEENTKEFKKSEFQIETVENFFNPKNDKVSSAAIVLVNDKDNIDFFKFKETIENLKRKKLRFDKKFTTQDDDSFYCSELVYYILKKSDNKISINLMKKKLTGIDKILLKRDWIIYYPTDIFFDNKKFEILEKWEF